MDKLPNRNYFDAVNTERLTKIIKDPIIMEEESQGAELIKVSETSNFAQFSLSKPKLKPYNTDDTADISINQEMETDQMSEEDLSKMNVRSESSEGEEGFSESDLADKGEAYAVHQELGIHEPVPEFFQTLSEDQKKAFRSWAGSLFTRIGKEFNIEVTHPEPLSQFWTFSQTEASGQSLVRSGPQAPSEWTDTPKSPIKPKKTIKPSPGLTKDLPKKSSPKKVDKKSAPTPPVGKSFKIYIGKFKAKHSKRVIDISPEINIQYGIVTGMSINIAAFKDYVSTRKDSGSCRILFDLDHPELRFE